MFPSKQLNKALKRKLFLIDDKIKISYVVLDNQEVVIPRSSILRYLKLTTTDLFDITGERYSWNAYESKGKKHFGIPIRMFPLMCLDIHKKIDSKYGDSGLHIMNLVMALTDKTLKDLMR